MPKETNKVALLFGCFALSACITHVIDPVSPELHGGSPLRSLQAARICVETFGNPENLSFFEITVHDWQLKSEPGLFVADALTSELERNGLSAERSACERKDQTRIGARLTTFVVRRTDQLFSASYTSVIEAELEVSSCKNNAHLLNKTYQGHATDEIVRPSGGVFLSFSDWDEMIKIFITQGISSLIKDITFDPEFVEALKKGEKFCNP